MNLLLVPLHIYSLPAQYRLAHAGLVARVYWREQSSSVNYHFSSISHSDGLTRAILTPDTPPKTLPDRILQPLERLINRQLDDLIEKKGEGIDSAYLFIRHDQGHYIIRGAIQRALEYRSVPLKIYISSDLTNRLVRGD
ncbi:MAG: hypothetical protein AABX47_09390 [Nanoarchaeota archaeon]